MKRVKFNATHLFLALEPVIEDDRCVSDADCPSQQACFGGDCKNPCLFLKPCGAHAFCTVHNTLPKRTMACDCESGYTSQGNRACIRDGKCDPTFRNVNPVPHIVYELTVVALEIGCSTHEDCPTSQACEDISCINPCIKNNPCAQIARCYVQDHAPKCVCPQGMTGDPYQSCVPSE